MSTHTIFALATPFAKSGVAVIRISGPRALSALQTLTGKADWQPNRALLSVIRHPSSHESIDTGLILFFAAPKSFTGEDVAELQVHGSLAVIRELLEALSEMEGLHPAEPGEFTRRAFLNGKMDLIQAEGLADVIDAETPAQKMQAFRQMEGAMSGYYESLRARIIRALALLEAYIDFPDEDIPEAVLGQVSEEVGALKATIHAALADGKKGERLRDGLQAVILGAPNAGKSSLLNYLAGREAAIVSHKAGTTRDIIEIHLNINGFPVILMDTAGLRDAADDIEEEGVRRALKRASSADLKLIMFDGASAPDAQSRGLIDDNSLIIINKIDICHPDRGFSRAEGSLRSLKPARDDKLFSISTKTGEGIDALMAALEERITALFSQSAAPVITRNRHRALLSEALRHLERIDANAALELTCEELRRAALAVGKITGKIAVDDVLDVIFKEFCIGK